MLSGVSCTTFRLSEQPGANALTPDHPTPELLDRLLAGILAEPEAGRVIAHLLGGCELCLRTLHRSVGEHRSGPELSDYDAVFTVSLARSAGRLARCRADELEAATLWATLEGTPAARRMQAVASDPRFLSRGLAARLLAAAGEYGWRDTGRGLEACRLALAILERLPAASLPVGLDHDLRARALGQLADALRLDDQLAAAEGALRRAWEALDDGTGDPLERAGLQRLEANLQLTLGDCAAATALLRPAASVYRLYGDRHQEGRTLQKLALAVGFEDPPAGVALAERALTLIEPGREPRAELAARHALIWFVNDCGMGWQALDLLERCRPLYRQLGDSHAHLLLPWLETRICRRLGRLAAAERCLVAVWHDFRGVGVRQELALVSLDLAETYIAEGKSRHAIRLLKVFHALLRHWRMHTEGMAAWLLLVEAAAGEAEAAQALTREAALYFRRAWRRALPFQRLPGPATGARR
jgi:hypothetical protein